jgi:hypothetical protein
MGHHVPFNVPYVQTVQMQPPFFVNQMGTPVANLMGMPQVANPMAYPMPHPMGMPHPIPAHIGYHGYSAFPQPSPQMMANPMIYPPQFVPTSHGTQFAYYPPQSQFQQTKHWKTNHS